MKNLFLSIFILLFVIEGVFASVPQKVYPTGFHSNLRTLLHVRSHTEQFYDFDFLSPVYYVDDYKYYGLLLIVDSKFDFGMAEQKGALIGSKLSNLISIKVPCDSLESFLNINGIIEAEADSYVKPTNDQARKLILLDSLIKITPDSMTHSGTNVLIGVLDGGFDFTHPSFFSSTGSNRIIEAWLQTRSGTPPSGFRYGSRIAPNAFTTTRTDINTLSHGSHVAATAAGGSFGTLPRFRGIATEANLAFVSPLFSEESIKTTGQSSLVDAITYVFDLADSKAMPAVVNMSLGTNVGPHDGTSIFDRACGRLTNKGKIIVASAGNDGSVLGHFTHTFQTTRDTIFLFPDLEGGTSSVIDIWGNAGSSINISIGSTSDYVGPWRQNSLNTSTNGTRTLSGNSAGVTYNSSIDLSEQAIDGKTRIYIKLTSNNPDNLVICLTGNGTFHAWNAFQGGSTARQFNRIMNATRQNDNRYSRVELSPDNNYMISEIGANSEAVIAAGAYVSKPRFTNARNQQVTLINQNIGEHARFSSFGPTVDSRVKPDICAPGATVVSAFNLHDVTLNVGQFQNLIAHYTSGQFTAYPYGGYIGTSMSAPVVSGAVALMLEANPYLTVQQVREILKETAIYDEFTGNINKQGDKQWGHGKLNVLSAVERSKLLFNPLDAVINDILIYPNPSSSTIKFLSKLEIKQGASIKIYDASGKALFHSKISKDYAPGEEVIVELGNSIAIGSYFFELQLDGFKTTEILVIKR